MLMHGLSARTSFVMPSSARSSAQCARPRTCVHAAVCMVPYGDECFLLRQLSTRLPAEFTNSVLSFTGFRRGHRVLGAARRACESSCAEIEPECCEMQVDTVYI